MLCAGPTIPLLAVSARTRCPVLIPWCSPFRAPLFVIAVLTQCITVLLRLVRPSFASKAGPPSILPSARKWSTPRRRKLSLTKCQFSVRFKLLTLTSWSIRPSRTKWQSRKLLERSEAAQVQLNKLKLQDLQRLLNSSSTKFSKSLLSCSIFNELAIASANLLSLGVADRHFGS